MWHESRKPRHLRDKAGEMITAGLNVMTFQALQSFLAGRNEKLRGHAAQP